MDDYRDLALAAFALLYAALMLVVGLLLLGKKMDQRRVDPRPELPAGAGALSSEGTRVIPPNERTTSLHGATAFGSNASHRR